MRPSSLCGTCLLCFLLMVPPIRSSLLCSGMIKTALKKQFHFSTETRPAETRSAVKNTFLFPTAKKKRFFGPRNTTSNHKTSRIRGAGREVGALCTSRVHLFTRVLQGVFPEMRRACAIRASQEELSTAFCSHPMKQCFQTRYRRVTKIQQKHFFTHQILLTFQNAQQQVSITLLDPRSTPAASVHHFLDSRDACRNKFAPRCWSAETLPAKRLHQVVLVARNARCSNNQFFQWFGFGILYLNPSFLFFPFPPPPHGPQIVHSVLDWAHCCFLVASTVLTALRTNMLLPAVVVETAPPKQRHRGLACHWPG